MLHTWGLFMAFLIPLWSFMALSLVQQINQPYICIYIYIPSIASCSLIDPPTSGKRLFSIAASIHIYTHMYIPIYVSINSKQMYLCVCAFFYYDVALKFLYQRATAITVLFWGILYIYNNKTTIIRIRRKSNNN